MYNAADDMMRFSYTTVALLLAVLLAGCATPTARQENPPAPDAQASSGVTAPPSPGAAKPAAVPPLAAAPTVAAPPAIPAEASPTSARAATKSLTFPGSGTFIKAPLAAAAAPAAGDIALNFEAADLREVVKAIVGDILKETYVIDPRVQGTISLNTNRPIAREALVPTLETLLRMNGAALIREEGIYKVVPAAAAARGSITPGLGGDRPPTPGEGYVVLIAPLKFIAAKEMVKILEPFVSDANSVRIDEARNLLFLFGTQNELRHLRDTIDMFDIDWLAGMSVGLFTLQSVDVKTASAELDKILGGNTPNPLSGVVKIVPIERLNALLVITHQPKYLEQAKIWIERLDHNNGASGGTRLFVYPVQNGQAEKMAVLLNNVFGKAQKSTAPPTLAPGLKPAEASSPATPPAAAPAPAAATSDSVAVSGDIRVIADKDNNALLILASPADYEKIESAVRKLDVVPRQVLIDVTIAEVTLTDEFKFGLEYYFTHGNRLSGSLNTSGVAALTPGLSYLWSNPRFPGGIGAALNMLGTDSRVKVISSPHIMVTDNQTAKINVGDKVPTTSQTQSVIGGTTTGVGVISTVQYLDTGILLTVKPHINAGGLVTMEINQEVSTASKTTTSGIDSPTISNRAVQSTVAVKSGETMMLGGLITEKKNNSDIGVPLLSQIPLLGGLFGTQDYANNRTELVILITPHMVANSQQAREVTEEFRRKMSRLDDVWERMSPASDASGAQGANGQK